MEGISRLITKKIPWFLLVKAALLAFVWLMLPAWVFALAALYLFFLPLGSLEGMFSPFVVAFTLALIAPPAPAIAIFLTCAFFIILGIKDFVIVERASAYEMLMLVLFVVASLVFFDSMQGMEGRVIAGGVIMLGGMFLILGRGFLRTLGTHVLRAHGSVVGLFALLVAEGAVVFLTLPLSYLHQAALFVFSAALLMDIMREYARERVTWKRLIMNGVAWALVALIVVRTSEWGL